jgi:Predicted membrane protein
MEFIINTEIVINDNSAFGLFLSYLYLFIIGSFLGWLIEVFFRRFFSMHRWTNPGFLKGPCLPLYGFGLCLLFTICYVSFEYICNGEGLPNFYTVDEKFVFNGNLNFPLTSLIVIIAIGIGMTVLEYLAGLIFIKGFRIKLWDYSNLKGNIQGIICPLFSSIWLVVGALYWFFIHPFINKLLQIFDNNIWVSTFFIGLYAGILILDVIRSCALASKLTSAAKKNRLVVDLSKFQLNTKLDLLKQKKDKTWIEKQTELAASKIKNRAGELIYDIKRHMYVNNTIPKTNVAESDETPRTKAERINKEKIDK